jgi:uncharacterized protein
MIKISKYSRVFTDIDKDVIVYNTINRGIVSLQKKYFIDNETLSSNIPADELTSLKEMEFVGNDIDFAQSESDYEEFNTLIISLETLLACNLACPYCYQIGNNSNKKTINTANLNLLYEYVIKVHGLTKFQNLALKVLGGEPAVSWETANYIIEKLSLFCKSNNIYFKLMIDTNATIIEDMLLLKGYDSLLFTIPLTYKECHDAYRKYPSGKGTYDEIIDNVNKLYQTLENATIVLRHNVDAVNITKFNDYIADLKTKLPFTPIISPNYTLNLGEGNYRNELEHSDFVKWLSSDFIDIMVEHNYPIVVSPFTLSKKCQYWSKYSMKVFSDGTVGACAMNFFDKDKPTLSEVIANIDNLEKFWGNAKGFSLFTDIQCKDCASLFLCGGTYKMPCIKAFKLKECEQKDKLHIDLNLFLERYLKYNKEDKDELFVGFNEYEIYK